MYDLLLVKKRRRRRIAAFVALFSSIGITSLVIISFLGRSVGTFTVSLKNSEVSLALVNQKDSKDYSTYLRVNDSTPYIEYSYDFFRHDLAQIDDEKNTYEDIGREEGGYVDPETKKWVEGTVVDFFKYTFYIKNVGTKTASYNLKVSIDDRTRADDNSGRGLDDTLRVMIFENDAYGYEHNYRVFAKSAVINNLDADGHDTDCELITTYRDKDNAISNRASEEYPLAEKFNKGSNTIIEYNQTNFVRNDMMRYTIVFWLEGGDPQSQPENEPPQGATLRLGVDIAAHENA